MSVRPGSGVMFDNIANKYDLLNRITSLGMDLVWRKRAVKALDVKPGSKVLDLASGTGDISVILKQYYSDSLVFALDPSVKMVKSAKEKFKSRNINRSICSLMGNGEELPFKNDSFDGVIVAFGIRNFKNRKIALMDILRVLKPLGKLVILELVLPERGVLSPLVSIYVQKVLPLLGGLISRKEEYVYLGRSMRNFPSPALFEKEIENAGFKLTGTLEFMFGTCCVFCAEPSGGEAERG
jgi:demethylmenaquinone methyltransferase/2-methoxy-6-polyprenyl-1,4-benzoquinol methylase